MIHTAASCTSGLGHSCLYSRAMIAILQMRLEILSIQPVA